MWARGGCSKTGMEISIATGSLVFFHLTSSHEEIHDFPMELGWKRELRVFGNQQQITMAAQKQTHTHESITKSHPMLNHKSSKCLPDKYSEVTSVAWRWPRMQNGNSLFISLPVAHCRDVKFGVTGLREVQQGWDWRFQAKQDALCDHHLLIRRPSDTRWCFLTAPQGLAGYLFPFLPLSCLKIHGCTNFCIAFDFFKILMKKSNWKKVSYIMN